MQIPKSDVSSNEHIWGARRSWIGREHCSHGKGTEGTHHTLALPRGGRSALFLLKNKSHGKLLTKSHFGSYNLLLYAIPLLIDGHRPLSLFLSSHFAPESRMNATASSKDGATAVEDEAALQVSRKLYSLTTLSPPWLSAFNSRSIELNLVPKCSFLAFQGFDWNLDERSSIIFLLIRLITIATREFNVGLILWRLHFREFLEMSF